jgi:hypothetical protein
MHHIGRGAGKGEERKGRVEVEESAAAMEG